MVQTSGAADVTELAVRSHAHGSSRDVEKVSFTGGKKMPGYDRSGPMGNGSMSGGGRGLCGSAAHPQRFAVSERGNWGGLGCRRGFGNPRGRGLRRGFGPLAEPTDGERQVNEKELLETQASELRQSLTRIQQRLDEL